MLLQRKYSFLLIVTLVFSTMSFSQDMNYFLQQKLNGVKNMTLNYFETNVNPADSAEKKLKKEEYLFDEEGRVISFKAYEKEILYLAVDYMYDSSGLIIKEIHTKEKKQAVYNFSYETDSLTGDIITRKTENGRLIFESKKKQAKNGFFYIDYSDASGNQLHQEYVDANGKIHRKFFYGTASKVEYRYDAQGNPIAIKTFSADGRSVTTRLINDYTNAQLDTITGSGKSLHFYYDQNGRLQSLTDSTAGIKTEASYILY